MENPIGIFDSGVGGLTVLKAIKRVLPLEQLIYLGDTARVPYGNKSKDTIVRYSIENTKFLMQFNIKMLVIACNTSTAMSLEVLRQMFTIPIVGVIEPGAKRAVEVSKNKRIGVIGTVATIKSKAYQNLIKSYEKGAVIFAKPCPLFVPLVEEGLTKGRVADSVVEMYLQDFKTKSVDTLVLGCTHYPLLKQTIKKFFEGKIQIVDSAEETAKIVRKILEENKIQSSIRAGEDMFFVTDAAERFLKVGNEIMRGALKEVKTVQVGR
ncbi:MAG: glutamate racemase [Proteobacteria bacterium]|nr:glutamate racemase [Pseudomonadota bacterium]